MDNQKILLQIVKKWRINRRPEYREFRCADCQGYLRKAFHHHLKYKGFKTPVHFCNICQKKFGSGGKYKIFTCDRCRRNIYKSFHVWTKNGKTMIETHYCKSCGDGLHT